MNEIINNIKKLGINNYRAIDYYDAVELGLEPRSYNNDIPIGVYSLQLIFKIWGNKRNLKCYFIDVNTQQPYQITFFTNKNNQYRYSANDNLIDFSDTNILGNIYMLHVGITRTGKPKIERAIFINKN